MGLYVNIYQVFCDNASKQGPEVIRKNNFINITGNNMETAKIKEIISKNKEEYGLSQQ